MVCCNLFSCKQLLFHFVTVDIAISLLFYWVILYYNFNINLWKTQFSQLYSARTVLSYSIAVLVYNMLTVKVGTVRTVIYCGSVVFWLVLPTMFYRKQKFRIPNIKDVLLILPILGKCKHRRSVTLNFEGSTNHTRPI